MGMQGMTNVELEAKVKEILNSGNMEAIQRLHDHVIDIGEKRYALQQEVIAMHQRAVKKDECNTILRCDACIMLNKAGLGGVNKE